MAISAGSYTGNTGKNYNVSSSGSITVSRPDGSTSTVNPGDASYNATVSAMNADSYRPSTSSSSMPTVSSSSPSTTTSSTVSSVSKPTTSSSTGFTTTNSSGQSVSGTYGTGMNNWTNVGTGSTGKTYATSNNNTSIYVTRPDGTTAIVNPGDANYNATYNAMQQDLKSNNINYTPTLTTERYIPTYDISKVLSGQAERGDRIEDTYQNYQTVNYLAGNQALHDAIFTNPSNTYSNDPIQNYVQSLYSRIGTPKADGTGNVTLQDVTNELNRVGLNDYAYGNAIYTVGGDILPGGSAAQYGGLSENQYAGSGSYGDQYGNYYNYGGRSYLTSGDAANFIQYVNGKTGNLRDQDYLMGNLTENPYIQADNQLYQALTNSIGDYYKYNGLEMPNAQQGNSNYINPAIMGSITGNSNVDNVINYINNAGSYAQSTGDSDLFKAIQQLLGNGLTATQDWLDEQRGLASKQAEDQSRAAWVNSQLSGEALREALSASGRGTTGALQSGMLGINNAYGNNLADVNSNLTKMLSNLNEQELSALADYYGNLGQYKYNISTDEANRNLQYQKMAQDQQQFLQNLELDRQQLALQQQAAELNAQKWQQSLSDNDYAKKVDQASYYESLYKQGVITDTDYVNALNNLGFTSGLSGRGQYYGLNKSTGSGSGGGYQYSPVSTNVNSQPASNEELLQALAEEEAQQKGFLGNLWDGFTNVLGTAANKAIGTVDSWANSQGGALSPEAIQMMNDANNAAYNNFNANYTGQGGYTGTTQTTLGDYKDRVVGSMDQWAQSKGYANYAEYERAQNLANAQMYY